jgi:hypothetical protein
MLMPGNKVEDAEAGAHVYMFYTKFIGLEM